MTARLLILPFLTALLTHAETPAQQSNRAWILIQQDKNLDAFLILKNTIHENPAFVRAYGLLGRACTGPACRDEAMQLLTLAGSGRREIALAHYGKGEIYAWSRAPKAEFASARREFAACIRADPNLPACYLGLSASFSDLRPAPTGLRDVERFVPIDPRNPATPLLEGNLLFLTGKPRQAQQVLEKGLADALAQNNEELAALYQAALGHACTASGTQLPEAQTFYQLALDNAIRADNVAGEVELMTYVVGSATSLGRNAASGQLFDMVLSRVRALGAWRSEVEILRMIGRTGVVAGDLGTARRAFREANELCMVKLDHTCAPDCLIDLGRVERQSGNPRAALQSYEEARDIAKAMGLSWHDAMASRGIASVFADTGDYFRALEWGTLSVEAFQKIGAWWPAAAGTGNLGDTYLDLGDFPSARQAYTTSLEITRKYADKSEESSNLLRMGLLALRAGRPVEAMALLEQGQRIALALSFRPYQVLASTAMAKALLRLGRHAEAMSQARAATNLAAELHDVKAEAEAQLAKGDCHLTLGEPSNAREAFTRSLSLAEQAGHLPVAAQARRGLARVEIQQGNLPQALQHYRNAIDELESIRGALPIASQRSGLLEQNWVYYNETISLIARLHASQPQEGLDRLALSYAERARARSLFEDLAEARAPKSELPEPLTADQVQAALAGTRDAILEFSLGDVRSQAWLITADDISMVALPARATLAPLVTRYRRFAAARPQTDADYQAYTATARELHHTLIAPLARKLAGLSNITIIPDGALHYLPFESLLSSPAGQPARFLIEDLAIHYAPSASIHAALLAAKPQPSSPMDLLAYGDPLYSRQPADSASAPDLVRRVYESAGARFPQLPNTRVELSRIGALFPPARERLRLGAEATEASVKSEHLDRYRILHFAAHAILDEAAPQRSGIVLSLTDTGKEDGVLRASEILNLRLNADLVVLSACQTGLGKLVRGEGVVGLTRAFLHAGARRVVVSLWEANDAATPDLMQAFYQALRQGQSAAAALRTAKLAMLHSAAPAYRHPYFWAPFVLAGQP